jgi:hypothetical protein
MTMKTRTVHPTPSRGPRVLTLAACGLLLVLGGAGQAVAQLPGTPPTLVFSDNFAIGTSGSEISGSAGWAEAHWDPYGDDGDWWTLGNSYLSDIDGPCPASNGRWTGDGSYFLLEDDSDQPGGGDGQSILVPYVSAPGFPWPGGLTAAQVTNIRIEFDFYGKDDHKSRIGAVWHAMDTSSPNDKVVDDAYLFYIKDFPDDGDTGEKSNYDLIKRVGGIDYVVATGVIDAAGDPSWPSGRESVFEDFCYRLRIDYYCGYVRVQVKHFDCDPACVESNWYTIVEWTDDGVTYGPLLPPNPVGLFSGSDTTSQPDNYYDNFELYSWGSSCGPPSTPTPAPTATPLPGPECTEWTAYTDENVEPLVFKLLYEGGLIDYSLGRLVPGRKIDVATTSPDPAVPLTYCDGWKLLVDLPDPIITSDLDNVRHYLQDTATAVQWLSDGLGGFTWSDSFDEDPASPTFNPVPMVADGSTPIGTALMDAFDWYKSEVETGGRWENDPLKECRKWYVVLITDGYDTCSTPGVNGACDHNQAAESFANPGSGIDPVPVFTIGFSESVAAAPDELTCISDITDGQYFGARNASELKDALYEVINQLNTQEKRAFVPFKVSPPPSSTGGAGEQQDFLAVFPFFQARKAESLWDGNLYGFKLDKTQPTLPVGDNCEVDASQLIIEEVDGNAWDARARLTEQLDPTGTPERHVYMASDGTGSWVRHDLDEIASDATLRLYLQNLMSVPGGITDLETQEVVNFVRGIWQDNDASATPDPRDGDTSTVEKEARPAGYAVLGDVYHSQPVIVSPPNRSMFFFDYGYGNAHDYPSFITTQAKRRRVVLAGANDGLLHAFDGGIWDRDRTITTEAYNDQHDLGDGSELFAYMPHAVAPYLDFMAYGKVQQYMVDGPIATSDVFIDYDGDSNREWRTVALATMRRGGRGIVALDITQPDPIDASDEFKPEVSRFPGCLDGTTSGCDGEYPKVLWEFKDTSDDDSNCPGGLTGALCSPYWDLGWTWSKPAIARLAVHNASDPTQPDDVFIAFFGGGWDEKEFDYTGNFFYGVDIETGAVVYKENIGVAVPGSPTALDSDIDGFHDRIYFADSDGSVYRLEFPGPADPAATGGDAGTLTRLFDFRAASGGFADRQRFFTRPVTVPAIFAGSDYTWALALGSGDRANLDHIDSTANPIDHFFFLLDVGDATTRGESDLVPVNYDELDGDFDCEDSALDPANGNYGWYLSLRPNEKVMFDATVVNGHVLFPTFDPTPNTFATHNVPDECVPVSTSTETPTTTPTATATPLLDENGQEVICKAAGIGRSYDLWFECGLGDYGENNDLYTGVEDYTIGGTTYVTFTESHFTEGETEEFPNVTGHVVTNWRQD